MKTASIALLFAISIIAGNTQLPRASTRSDFYAGIQRDIERGDAISAISSLQKFLRLNQKDSQAHNLLGLAYTSMHQLSNANAEFARAIALDKNFAAALRNLAINEESLGLHQASLEHFKQVLRIRSADPVASAYLGSDKFVSGDYKAASELLLNVGPLAADPTVKMEQLVSQLLKVGEPRNDRKNEDLGKLNLAAVEPSMLVVSAVALAQSGLYSEALTFFQALPPELQRVQGVTYDRALCLIRTQHPEEASRILGAYLKGAPHTGSMLSLAAEAYAKAGEVQKAIDALREATSIEPSVEEHYIDLAEICTQYDAYGVGIDVLNVGLRVIPNSDRLYFERGVLEAMKNDFEAADRDFKKAQAMAPGKSMAGLAIGVGMMQAGNLDAAIRELRTKATTDKNNAVLQYMLAEALLQNGAVSGSPDRCEARAALETALHSDANYEPPLVALARMLIEEDKFVEAHDLLRRATTLTPDDSAAFSQLAIVDHRLGLKDEASRAVTRLTQINQKQREDRHRLQISAAPAR